MDRGRTGTHICQELKWLNLTFTISDLILACRSFHSKHSFNDDLIPGSRFVKHMAKETRT
jgi:hypothetical protein